MTCSDETGTSPVTFDAVYAAHHRRVLLLATRMVGPTAAPDIAQTVWLKVYRGLHTYDGRSALTSWLHAITKHEVYNLTRTRKADGHRRSEPIEAASDVEADGPTPETLAIARDEAKQLAAAVNRLSGERQAVILAGLTGLDVRTTAQLLGIPENTVKSRSHRARAALRAALRLTLTPTLTPTLDDSYSPRRGRRSRLPAYAHVTTCPHAPTKATP